LVQPESRNVAIWWQFGAFGPIRFVDLKTTCEAVSNAMRMLFVCLLCVACTRPSPNTVGGEISSDLGSADSTQSFDLGGEASDLTVTAALDLAPSAEPDLMAAPDLSSSANSGGTVPLGGACAFTATGDNCVAGQVCVARREPANGGICRRTCVSDDDCPKGAVGPAGNTSHCLQSANDPTQKTCTIPCNPVVQSGASGCQAGLFCWYGDVAGMEITTCADDPGMNGSFGCDANLECSPGYVCETFVIEVCDRLCRVGHDEDCGPNYPYCGAAGTTKMYATCQKT
jgi:hypothetical protein